MKGEIFEKGHFDLNKDSWFEFDGFIIEGETFGDIRSIHGFISGVEFNKENLKEILHQFLRHSNNIELVNILSRKFNKHNFFEIYNGESPRIEITDLLGKSEVGLINPTTYLISTKRCSKKGGQLIQKEVNSHMYEGITLYEKLNLEDLN